jgi:hypothetical protein
MYCDSRRIASFLAQFDDMGTLDKIVHREGVTRNSKRGWNFNLSGGGSLLGTGAQGGAAFGVTPEAGGTEVSERFYDPFWTNARTLLDYLLEHRLINQNMEKPAALGQFVLVKGSIVLLDLGLLRGAWEKPPIQKAIKATVMAEQQGALSKNRHERRAQGTAAQGNSLSEMDALISLISLLPHTLQIRLFAEKHSFWSTLDESSVVGRASDLMLKHGALLGGQWHMLGVLDAFPYDPQYRTEDGKDMSELLAELAVTAIGQMVARLAPAVQPMMGRPAHAWGITPLLIFRDVAGGAHSESPSSA